MDIHAFRLTPGQDLKKSLVAYANDVALEAGCIVTCVGSLSKVTIRLANCSKHNKNETVSLDERFEIVSLTGTLSRHGAHLHVSIADFQGNVVGGHLMDGCEAGDGPERASFPVTNPKRSDLVDQFAF